MDYTGDSLGNCISKLLNQLLFNLTGGSECNCPLKDKTSRIKRRQAKLLQRQNVTHSNTLFTKVKQRASQRASDKVRATQAKAKHVGAVRFTSRTFLWQSFFFFLHTVGDIFEKCQKEKPAVEMCQSKNMLNSTVKNKTTNFSSHQVVSFQSCCWRCCVISWRNYSSRLSSEICLPSVPFYSSAATHV